MTRYVFRFDELDAARETAGGDWDSVRALLGGKGAGLADMTSLGIHVPPGFTVTTAACNEFLRGGDMRAMWDQQVEALHAIESSTGKTFGDPDQPLLVSCRSGAKFSMPGMMDTILNLGLNRALTEKLAGGRVPERLAWDLYRRLLQMFGGVALGIEEELFENGIRRARHDSGIDNEVNFEAEHWQALAVEFEQIIETETGEPFPADPYDQLRAATRAVFESWNSDRAISYRRASGIPDDLGTAVNVQLMVFGNLDEQSGTGVCMSRDATTGVPELEGDYLMRAQGEDVVAGTRTTHRVARLREDMPAIYEQLTNTARTLERHYGDMQDIEFTIESGRLWILQSRAGKRTAAAAMRIAVDLVAEGLIDTGEAVQRIEPDQVDFFLHPQFDAGTLAAHAPIAEGLNVSPGAAVGELVLDPDRAVSWAESGRTVVLVRNETKPDDVHGMLAAQGILTRRGGRTSHAARRRGWR